MDTSAWWHLLGSVSVPSWTVPTIRPPTPVRAALAAALDEARDTGIYAEEGEIVPDLSCYAIPLLHHSRDEKLAVAIRFESRRPEKDRRFIRHALRREWREVAWQI